jgi:alkanesulfonate monooxygenase SsuD/methylene tetrahydromethanopterin reductase-like flavin-dependent oxidoreductase (luciferase family)
MEFATWIPSYCYKNLSYDRVRTQVRDFSKKANELGIDLWVIDHLLHAPGLYGLSWLEPLTTLTFASAVAPDVRLGTGILVLPLRHPVVLAKEIAAIDFLTGGRFIFGAGPGWYPGEFAAVGTKLEERGRRTDEILDAVRKLLTQDRVTFKGEFYEFHDVTIEPRPPKMPEVWISGGSRIPDPGYTDVPVLAKSVLNRVLGADAWLSRCSGSQEFVKRDWETIRRALREQGRPENSIRFAHTQFTYIVDTDDREKALHVQRPFFEEVMGTHRSFEHLQECYLLGSVNDIVERLKDLKAVGLEYALIGPVSDDIHQLELISERIIPALNDSATPATKRTGPLGKPI